MSAGNDLAGRYTLGVDIGGTFTDIVLLRSDGVLFSRKVLSTPDDYSRAIEEGVAALLRQVGIDAGAIAELAHGTTIATNAIIERRGVRVALVTTRGFRDVLEIGRFRSPRLYDLRFRKPDPLVERRLRFEVRERISGRGEVVEPLDREGLATIAARIATEKMDAVAVCFINSYVNPAHEDAACAFLAQRLSGVSVSSSTQLLPQINEYERTSTTVVNAYIRPVVERYVASLEARLGRMCIRAPLMIMQSSGGLLPGAAAGRNPVNIIESGPAAGVVGAQRLACHIDLGDVIVLDMGGTTAKASIVENRAYGLTPETEVGGGAALGHRLIQGAGYVVQVPTIDIAEVGAGGGSIAAVDAAGGLRVGPLSAGAEPGPACYDRGGEQATVTDANLLLGYLNPDALVGGELKVNAAEAERAVAAIGRRMGLATIDAAYGIHMIANANMMRALNGVTSERGRDPAKFALFAIGGNGGVHAGQLAETMRITRILVPPVAGLFSALGMLFADVEHRLVSAFYHRHASVTADLVNRAAQPLIAEARRLLASEGYGEERQQRITLQADLKHVAQTGVLTIAFERYPVDAAALAALAETFFRAHLEAYGYRSDREPVQFVVLKVVAQGVSAAPRVPQQVMRGNEPRMRSAERRAYFGSQVGWLPVPVLGRAGLSSAPMKGPLIVEEYDTTTLVRPAWQARIDSWNNIVIERAAP